MALLKRCLGSTGLAVSVLGFGASPLGGVFEQVNEAEGVAAVHEAVRLGVNFFDVSPYYGDTRAERVLGSALKELPRDQFVLSTKVGRYGSTFDFSAERVTRSVQESMERLCVSYIDIVQCHDIEFVEIEVVLKETLPALQALKQQGKIGFVGITGLPLRVFRRVLDRAPPGLVDVALSYCHFNLVDRTLLTAVPYFQEKGVGLINASPLAMGLLTKQGPPAWHPAPAGMQAACASAALHCSAKGVDISELAIQVAVRHEAIASTLVGMCTRAQVRANVSCAIAAFDEGALDGAQQVLLELQALFGEWGDATWPSGLVDNN